MNKADFARERQAAIERLREMSARSKEPYRSNGFPHNETERKETEKENRSTVKSGFFPQQNRQNEPSFLDFLKDKDTALIIGLLLVLINEDADRKLLFALLYILL